MFRGTMVVIGNNFLQYIRHYYFNSPCTRSNGNTFPSSSTENYRDFGHRIQNFYQVHRSLVIHY